MDLTRACSSVRDLVDDQEWAARVELAAFYRVVDRYGWSQLTNNHITLRVPGAERHFLLNPYGLSYEEITASSLVKVDLEGNIVLQPDHGLGINPTGFVIHGAIHAARHDLNCVIHTHSQAGVVVSMMADGLQMTNNSAFFVVDNVAYHDWEGPSLDREEEKRLVANLGDKSNMILRHHGLLACGRNVGEAFLNLHSLETACRIQVDAMATGARMLPPPHAAAAAMRKSMQGYRGSGRIGRVEWAAELRRQDRIDPGYRQ